MAVHHPATIAPTKRELLQAWVPRQPWTGGGDLTELTPVGSYRFDDPDGEVGMETHLLATPDGRVLQVPLTYRGTPGPPDTLVTTMTHTTLGDRWIHDGCHDPVLLTALATTVLHGGREADLDEATPDGLTLLPATTHVRGDGPTPGAPTHPGDWTHPHVEHTGTTTVVRAPRHNHGLRLVLPRVVHPVPVPGATLRGTWPGQDTPVVLAVLTPDPPPTP
ncbi:hypothetical protein AB1207_13475 [Kineococcus endophyticus]|uniref:Maltokinase N-terminal cap domain-containing protein n=1 Tax=Kineococcus endophyticus TaxID=1181883 RepID=A0ABV3P801_9ACTN